MKGEQEGRGPRGQGVTRPGLECAPRLAPHESQSLPLGRARRGLEPLRVPFWH